VYVRRHELPEHTTQLTDTARHPAGTAVIRVRQEAHMPDTDQTIPVPDVNVAAPPSDVAPAVKAKRRGSQIPG
jgi:hypothetical protein